MVKIRFESWSIFWQGGLSNLQESWFSRGLSHDNWFEDTITAYHSGELLFHLRGKSK
jgi:hypothetical protein